MTRSPINYAPAILLTVVSLLFAVTWAHDVPAATYCAVPTRTAVRVTEPTRYPAATGLFTAGRAALRRSLQTADAGLDAGGRPADRNAAAYDWLAPLLRSAAGDKGVAR